MMDDLLSARPGGHSRYSSAASSNDEPASDRGINFTMFLTMMSERLFEFDTEAELLEAFECFDEDDTGMVKTEEMRKWLSEVGERMDQQEVSTMHATRLFFCHDFFSRFAYHSSSCRLISCSKDRSLTDKATSIIASG